MNIAKCCPRHHFSLLPQLQWQKSFRLVATTTRAADTRATEKRTRSNRGTSLPKPAATTNEPWGQTHRRRIWIKRRQSKKRSSCKGLQTSCLGHQAQRRRREVARKWALVSIAWFRLRLSSPRRKCENAPMLHQNVVQMKYQMWNHLVDTTDTALWHAFKYVKFM